MDPLAVLSKIRSLRGVIGVCVTITCATLGQGAIAPILPLFAQGFGVEATFIGLAVGIFGTGRILTNVPSGFLAQRYGRRLVLVIGPLIGVFGALFTGLADNIWDILLFRGLSGIGGGIHFVGAAIYLRDISTTATRARYMSLQPLSILTGASIGPVLGGLVGDIWGLQAPFFMMAGLLAFAVLVALLVIPEPPRRADREQPRRQSDAADAPDAPRERGGIGALLRNPTFYLVGFFTLMVFFNRSGARFTILPLFAAEKGLSTTELGAIFTFTAIPQLLTVLGAGAISDRLGRKTVILPAACIIVTGLATFALGEAYGILALSAMMLGVGEGFSGSTPAAFFADMSPRGLEGITMGLYRTFGDIGFLTGPLLLGWVAERTSFAWSLGLDGLLLLTAAFLVVLLARDTIQRRAAQPRPTAR